MRATHITLPVTTAQHALLAIKGMVSDLGQPFEGGRHTPGTGRWHLGDMLETAQRHEQALTLAISAAKHDESLQEVCAPLIDRARLHLTLARDRGDAEERKAAFCEVYETLAALKLALSAPEGGAPKP